MPADFTGYLVATGETSNAPGKQDPFITAVQNALNNIGDLAQMGFAAGQIIDLNKLKQTAATIGQAVVWNGSAWAPGTAGSVTLKKVTEKEVVNLATKQDLLNGEVTLLANTVGANSAVRIWLAGDYLNNSGSSRTIQLELKLGSQVIWDSGASDSIPVRSVRRGWYLDAVIQALAGTSSQRGSGAFTLSSSDSALTGTGAIKDTNANPSMVAAFLGVATTVNMTADQTLTFSVTHSAANTSLSMRLEHAFIEIIG